MNRNRILIFGGLLLLAAVILALSVSYGNQTRPVEPTPTPLPPESIRVACLGAPMLKDPEIKAILAEPWTAPDGTVLPPIIVDTSYADLGTSQMLAFRANAKENKPADYTGIDCVQAGDSYYANLFHSMNPGVTIVQQAVVYNTKLMMYTWYKHLPAFIAGGYAVKTDNYYYMPPEKAKTMLNAEYQQYIAKSGSWRDIGVNLDNQYNGPVDLNGPSYGSSTGIEQMAWMSNCFAGDCTTPVSLDQMNSVLPYLTAYVTQQGAQGKGSLSSFNDFLTNGEGTVTFVSYDSALPTVANENGWTPEFIKCITSAPDDPNAGSCKKDSRIVGIYLGGGTSAQHTFMAITPNGQLLLKRLSDPRIQAIAWKKLGAATPAVFMYDAPISWMSTTVPQGNKPADAVYASFLDGLNAFFAPKK